MVKRTSIRLFYSKESEQGGLPKKPEYGQNYFGSEETHGLKILDLSLEYAKSYIHCSLGEFGPTLEGVVALTGPPMFGKSFAMNIILDEKDEKRLESLYKAYSGSKTKNKRTYASWLRYFETGKG